MTPDEKRNILERYLKEDEQEIRGKMIDLINSPIYHGSMNAARKLCHLKYLLLNDQVKADHNKGMQGMLTKLQRNKQLI
jgi:hypothetical protein